MKLGDYIKYIPRPYLNKFFERYNQVGLEKTEPRDQCSCNDLYDICLHAIAAFQPKLEQRLEAHTKLVHLSAP